MSPAEWFIEPWCRPVALALLHFLWQGALVAGVLAVLVELLGIRQPKARYACSLAALMAMLLSPGMTLGWIFLSAPAEPLKVSLGEISAGFATSDDGGTTFELLAASQPYLLSLWLAGVTFFATRLLMGLAGVERLRRNLSPVPPELAGRVHRLGSRMRMNAVPLVHLSRQVSEALAVGLFRPLVLIPAAWATEMPADMLEAVIAHELAHLRRGDLWINLAQRLVETLLFYHPAVWWLSRRLRIERELCCDELAVTATGRRLEYAQALEHVASWRVARVQPLLAAGIRGEKNMRLLQRVRNVLGLADRADRLRLWPAGIVALALPLAAWAIATGFATADDERKEGDKPAEVRKEGARDGEVRKEGVRDGEVRKNAPRDGEVRKEGPRDGEVRKEGARDGEGVRKEGAPRDGEAPRKPVARDGDAPRKEGAPRDGDAPRKPVVRDGDRPAGGDAQIGELMAQIKKLTAQVQQLQAELNAARGVKEGFRKEPVKPVVREGDKKPEVRKEEPRREGDGVKKPEVRKEEPRREAVKQPEVRRDGEGVKKPEARKDEPRR